MMGYWNQGILRGEGGPLLPRGGRAGAGIGGWGVGGSWALPEMQPLGEDGVLLDAADAVKEDGPLAAFHCGEKGHGQGGRRRNGDGGGGGGPGHTHR